MNNQDSEQLSTSEYFAIISEIDATYFCLEQLIGEVARRTPLEQMVDKATGYDKEQTDRIKMWVARIKELQSMLPPDDWHFKRSNDDK